MATYDRIYFAGQAKSHCVLESITSIARYEGYQPGLLEKVYLLEDCTSAVAHPKIDFDAMANEQFEAFAKQGLNAVTSRRYCPSVGISIYLCPIGQVVYMCIPHMTHTETPC
jgi:nicotinamidase-related amidase